MPMTLKRHINGRVVPITLSISDCFRISAPVPPRKKKGESSKPAEASTTGNPAPGIEATCEACTAATSATSTTNGLTDSTKITKQGDDEAHTFTAGDDAKLIEMKVAGKTWKEIVTDMKKSQSALKERFKEIGPKPDGSAGAAAGDDKQKKNKEAETKTTTTDGKKKAEKQAQKPATATASSGKKDKKSVTIAATDSTGKSSFSSSKRPTKDPFTLAEIAARYERDKWRFAASKYYDMTGVRISKEEARRRALAGE